LVTISLMTLPEDLTRWPDDPYALLGVEQNIGARDLRRAYTRLIKLYKPEHSPEEFRKLREAYEKISQHLEWRERYGVHVEANTSDSDDEPAATNGTAVNDEKESAEYAGQQEAEEIASNDGATSAEEGTAANRRPGRTIVTDPLRDAWQLALDGSHEEAFAELRKFASQHGMTPAVAVRLYWLLVTYPELDPKIQPASILARGLMNDGWDSPLAVLYRRELIEEPAETESQRCEQLLAAAPAYILSDWLPIRWRASLKKNRWDLVQNDLDRFRPAIHNASEHQWTALLFEALDQLAWPQNPHAAKLYQQCRAELESFTHLQLPLSNAYDRADLLSDLKQKYRELVGKEGVPDALKELLAECWDTPYPQLRMKLAHFAQWLAQQPETGLKSLDRIHSVGKSLLGQLNEALRRFAYSEGVDFDTDPDPDQLRDLLALFLARNKVWYYHDLRQPLLEFCLRHGVLCEEITGYCSPLLDEFRLANGELLLPKLMEDLPLRCACYAQRAYYG
jgi:hypothetical protein